MIQSGKSHFIKHQQIKVVTSKQNETKSTYGHVHFQMACNQYHLLLTWDKKCSEDKPKNVKFLVTVR